MTEMLQRAFERASRLTDGEQDVLAVFLMEEIEGVSSKETLETFLGAGLHRPPASEEEMAELRRMAETEPGLAALLRIYDEGGCDVDAILALRNA